MSFWFYLGIILILWVIYDLVNGVTWIYRPIYRKYEPLKYWIVTAIWLIVAVYTTYTGLIYFW